MPFTHEEKKMAETRVLSAARGAGVPIPLGEIPGEEPDFRFLNGESSLGIELSELVRPASSNSGIVPAAEAAYHKDIVKLAQEKYYACPGATPVKIVLYFAN